MATRKNGRKLIHSIPIAYNVDGNRGVRDPRGMYGHRLGVNMHIVTAASGAVRNLTTCIERCHLDVSGYVVSPYASGLAALVEDEMELGVTIIDMGGGTTTIAVFYEGNAIFTDVVPVGGSHVTSDIARGLSTALGHAERMKTLYGHALATGADERETIDVPRVGEENEAGNHQVPRFAIGWHHPTAPRGDLGAGALALWRRAASTKSSAGARCSPAAPASFRA